MLVFAYDGSLNGDWVAHYAVRFAANTSARKLRLGTGPDPAVAPGTRGARAPVPDLTSAW